MSVVLALASRSRIKPSHRRRRKAASAHLVYIGNNPLSGKDPTGYCSTGTHIGGGDDSNCEGLGVTFSQVGSPSVSAMKAASDHAMSRTYMQSIFGGSSGADSMSSKGASSTPLNGQASSIGAQSGTVNGIASATEQSTAQKTYESMSQGNMFERADAAFVAGFGQTYAAWQSLLTGQPGHNPFSGATVAGVDAWNERFFSAAALAIPEGRIGEALQRAAIRGIETPWGIAEQSGSAAAMAARQQVEGGALLYRAGTLGKSEAVEGQFWSLEHPSTPGYAGRYGIPPGNLTNANFVESARLRQGSNFVTRPAPGYGGNPGGGIEAVVPKNGVEMQWFSQDWNR